MNEQRNLERVAKLARALERLQSLCTERAAGGHDLYADDDVAIGFDRLLYFGLIDQTWIGKNAVTRTTDAAQGRQIDVVQHTRICVVGDVIAEDIEQRMSSATGVDNSRDAGTNTENIGVDAEGAESFHQVEMNVDQTGRHDAILRVDNRDPVSSEIRADGFDLAVANTNIECAIFAARRVDEA